MEINGNQLKINENQSKSMKFNENQALDLFLKKYQARGPPITIVLIF